MTAIANLPDLRPSLLLDFANSGRVDPRVQFTRPSAATCFGSDGKLRTVAANVPRIDYDPATGKCRGLLVEEARTNLLTQANNFADASWTKNAATLSVEQSHTLNPEASVTKFVESAGEGPHILEKFATVPGSTAYVCSIYVKPAGRPIIRINSGRSSIVDDSGLAQFDLSTGTITTNTNGLATMQHCGGGWYRCSITARALEDSANRFLILTLVGPSGSVSYTGDGVSGVYLCNAQLELGTFPTSYIPTEESAVTRAADTVQLEAPARAPASGFSFISEQVCTWGVGEYPVIFSDSKTLLGSYIGVRVASGGSYVNSTEGARTTSIGGRPAAGEAFKLGGSFSAAGVSVAARGGATSVGTAPATAVADLSKRSVVKFGATSAAATLCMHLKSLRLYSAQLSSTQLQRLTA